MGILYLYVVAFFLLINLVHGNDTVTYPNFPRQAHFFIENIITLGQYQRISSEIRYDYDNNRLVTIDDRTFTYYNYTIRQKSTYPRDDLKICNVYPIDIDNPLDGLSALTNPNNGTSHIRPLDDFLGFPSNATYLGEAILRGFIVVNQWILPMSNESDMIWSFAKPNYIMPWNPEKYTIPIQSILKRKSDGAILQVMNIFSYKTMLTSTAFVLPSGIFCEKLIPADDLLSLQDIGINFPEKFSVRIDASSTSQHLWHTVHLRYYSSNESKFIRYDYTPFDNTQNPVTIILDYTEGSSRSYKIDRRTGSCIINDSVEIVLMTSILHNPIETLIKYQNLLLTNPPHRIFQSTGSRTCRGSMICSIFVGQLPLFPLDLQEDWLKTTLEWGWSKPNIDDANTPYDYPVYLNLNLYRKTGGPPANVRYEFYNYDRNVYFNEFDINLCYRSNQLWYKHLAFQLKIIGQPTSDGLENGIIHRRRLTKHLREQIGNITSVKYSRISQLELDHHFKQAGHNDTLYCIFTLLDRTPFVDPSSEIEILDAQMKLEQAINTGTFRLTTEEGLAIEAVPNSLEDVQYFYVFNPNASANQIDYFSNTTVHVNQTITEYVDEIHEKIEYSDGAQAGAVLGGMIIGILVGLFIVFLVVYMIKRKTNMSVTGGLNFRNISFRIRNNQTEEDQSTITMEEVIPDRNKTLI
ncbi:hypothetical protein I4U23_008738 [Adineta vaga]|nr:hypothetical protein I4U23_008738 [Adineta vaga]